jgi:hypothetical protein
VTGKALIALHTSRPWTYYLQTHGIETHVSGHGAIKLLRSDQERNRLGHFLGVQGNRSRTLGLLQVKNKASVSNRNSFSLVISHSIFIELRGYQHTVAILKRTIEEGANAEAPANKRAKIVERIMVV